jgi:hypothetical protein
MLKWKADFRSTLGSCIILGATSALSSSAGSDAVGTTPSIHGVHGEPEDNSGNIPESFYTTIEGLKLRVLWTI